MAMNQTVYVTNPDSAVSGTVATANGNLTLINNTSGEPLKILGLKLYVGATTAITAKIGSGTAIVVVEAASAAIGDVIDLLAPTKSIATAIDANGSRYFLLQAGATLVIGATSTQHVIFYFYESYTA